MSNASSLFERHELLKEYDENWLETAMWKRLSSSSSLNDQLIRDLQDEHAGVTLIGGSRHAPAPVGSGVLVRSATGYGILTAGHVCKRVERQRASHGWIGCLEQGPRTPVPADTRTSMFIRPLPPGIVVKTTYRSTREIPDYGCLVVPELGGREMAAWGTFINLTEGMRSRRIKSYEFEHNAWVAAGFLGERSTSTAAYHWHAIGGPEALYERNGKRYLRIIDVSNDPGGPSRLNGMSGSGVWEIPLWQKKGKKDIRTDRPILRGICFLQESSRTDRWEAFYAHELETIAEDVLGMLDEQ